MSELLDKLLGGFVIPPGWKGAIYGFLVALIAMLSKLGVPGLEWATESAMMSVAAVIAIGLSLILKKVRSS